MCTTVVAEKLPFLWGNSPLCTRHFTLNTLHSTLYTPHCTLYTPHPTLYTPHFTLHTLHCTLHTLHSTVYTPHSTLYTPHSTSPFDSGSPCLRFLHMICIRVRWFLLFFFCRVSQCHHVSEDNVFCVGYGPSMVRLRLNSSKCKCCVDVIFHRGTLCLVIWGCKVQAGCRSANNILF